MMDDVMRGEGMGKKGKVLHRFSKEKVDFF